jgi:hypothetical protein
VKDAKVTDDVEKCQHVKEKGHMFALQSQAANIHVVRNVSFAENQKIPHICNIIVFVTDFFLRILYILYI